MIDTPLASVICRMWMNLKSIWETLSPVNLIKQSADSFTLRFLSRPSTHSSQVCIRYTSHRVYKYLVTWLIQKILHAYRDDLSWDQISKSNYRTTATFISDFNKRTHCYFYKEYINLLRYCMQVISNIFVILILLDLLLQYIAC